MKKNGVETMEILEAFDKTGCAHSAAALAGCDPKTVRRLVARREAGLGADALIVRPRLVDGFTGVVEQLVAGSEGVIRADVAHEKLMACGYVGSERTTRRAVAAANAGWRADHARSNRPWITLPGMWCQFDWGDGPKVRDLNGRLRSTVLFVAWVAWSRFRVVIPCWDQTSESLATCLDSMFRLVGGVTDYVLTDNAKTVTVRHIAGVPVRHPSTTSQSKSSSPEPSSCSQRLRRANTSAGNRTVLSRYPRPARCSASPPTNPDNGPRIRTVATSNMKVSSPSTQ